MSKSAYIIDIAVRSFFIWLVLYLLIRQWFGAVAICVAINLVYELTVGKKYWRQFKNAPKKPRRSVRTIFQTWWHRCFCRERTKGLVMAGLVILLMSWVVPLNVYYIVCACVVFTLAAISRFAPPSKSVTIPCETTQDQSNRQTDCPPPATK